MGKYLVRAKFLIFNLVKLEGKTEYFSIYVAILGIIFLPISLYYTIFGYFQSASAILEGSVSHLRGAEPKNKLKTPFYLVHTGLGSILGDCF